VKNTREGGIRLIQEAEDILRRDAQGALNEKDFNMAVRRAQEVVGLKRGIDDPALLQRIEEVSLWLAESRASSFYLDREYGAEDAEKAIQDAAFVLSEAKKLLGLAAIPA